MTKIIVLFSIIKILKRLKENKLMDILVALTIMQLISLCVFGAIFVRKYDPSWAMIVAIVIPIAIFGALCRLEGIEETKIEMSQKK